MDEHHTSYPRDIFYLLTVALLKMKRQRAKAPVIAEENPIVGIVDDDKR